MARGANEETSETDRGKRRTPLTMIIPAGLLAAAAFVVGLLPDVGRAVEAAIVRFQDQAGYNAHRAVRGAHRAPGRAVSACRLRS